ncbi:MAG: hypothetical protein ABSE63_10310 [Thermoguttaceae bacterium]|jgi:hypothetical protein
MDESFLPFPRGQTASGINAGNPSPSSSFFNKDNEGLIDALRGESERAQVLIAAEFLNKALRGCFCAKFKLEGIDDELINDVLGGEESGGDKNALGAFGHRISVSRALGFIDNESFLALRGVKDIRNAFAHKDFKIALTSDNEKVRRGMNKLREWLGKEENKSVYSDPQTGKTTPTWRVYLANEGYIINDPVSERHIFLGATIMLYILLINAKWEIRKEEFSEAIILSTRPHGT